ncbi:hypothetical protein [Paraburkholderia humisilvae]|uniref:hypothetical protein n=1 Tax=Paraburkholderia humisilvae TaxID=627669 RepID=UPI001581B55D|nr:hypothetical protein [Paraburkholderia humisilvae]
MIDSIVGESASVAQRAGERRGLKGLKRYGRRDVAESDCGAGSRNVTEIGG